MQHSSIGASAAKRWISCPGSIELCKQAPPQKPSKYAKEGTQAHTVAEAMLLGKPIPPYADEAMIEGAKLYSQVITEKLLDCHDITIPLHLESRVSIPSLSPNAFGTCDAWFVGDATLYVIDYKYGQGVPVSAEQNYQLLYYAAGVIESFLKDVYIKDVVIIVVQPRCGGANEWRCGVEEVKRFLLTAKDALTKKDVVTGDHCRWCNAQSICPAKRAEVEAMFNLPVTEKPQPPSPVELTPDQLVQYIEYGESLQSWIKSCKWHLQSMIEMGVEVPGWGVETGLSNRSWKELCDAELHLRNQYGDSIYNKPTLKSPAQIEKIKGVDKKIIAELTERKPTEAKLVRTTNGSTSGLFQSFTEE